MRWLRRRFAAPTEKQKLYTAYAATLALGFGAAIPLQMYGDKLVKEPPPMTSFLEKLLSER